MEYTVEDFVKDEGFRRWVLGGDEYISKYWEEVLLKNPAIKPMMEEARKIVLLLSDNQDNATIEEYGEVWNKIDFINRQFEIDQQYKKEIGFKGYEGSDWRKIAAVAALLILLGTSIYFLKHQILLSPKYGMVEEINPKGKKSMLLLPDGTKVWLNAESVLRYSKDWDDKEIREVFLEGEAFFEVIKNKKKPFIVSTNKIAVKVLGTAFNVKSYSDDDKIETTLVRGKVVINNINSNHGKGRGVLLKPNQKATYSKKSERITLASVKAENDISWKSGKLIFEDESFGEIIEDLERWYGVNIVFENNISLNCRFSAQIEHESLRETLDLFRSAGNFSYSIKGKEVKINGNPCQQ